MDQISLSIVLPFAGGSGSLATTVAECLALTTQHAADVELILADDASSDGAAALADRLAGTHGAVAVIHYPRRRGYRQTLRDAWGVARGSYIAALDLAGPASAADIARLLPAAPQHAAILGYRVPTPRRPTELAFAAAVSARIAPGLRDPALGLGLFRADLRDLLLPVGPDALAHAELYAAAGRRGLATAQIAVAGKTTRTTPPSLAEIAAALAGGEARPDANAPDPSRPARQRTAVGASLLLAVGSLWALRRRRRP